MSNITIYKGIEITEVNTYHYVFTLNGMKYINKNLKFAKTMVSRALAGGKLVNIKNNR